MTGSDDPPGSRAGTGPARGRPRREDPQPLLSAIDGLLEGRGWQRQAAMGSVMRSVTRVTFSAGSMRRQVVAAERAPGANSAG